MPEGLAPGSVHTDHQEVEKQIEAVTNALLAAA
jgi:hypothetical protein